MKIMTVDQLLPEFEYIREVTEKDTIVLHHTVSSTGKHVADWFKADRGKSRVAVPYVIDKDGTIYQLFDPKYWAYHTGTGNKNNIEKRSIGIELVNEGPLKKIGEDYFWFDAKYKYKGLVFDNEEEWRGYRYFSVYMEKQLFALFDLLEYLFDRFPKITPRFSNELNYSENYFDYPGVITHVNIRKDKTDLSPAFPIKRLDNYIWKLNKNKLLTNLKILTVEQIPYKNEINKSEE